MTKSFDLIFQAIAPEIEIITPIRDLKLSRQEEVDYLSKNGVHYSWEKPNIRLTKDFGDKRRRKRNLNV
jgi:argininosuccinate synthase